MSGLYLVQANKCIGDSLGAFILTFDIMMVLKLGMPVSINCLHNLAPTSLHLRTRDSFTIAGVSGNRLSSSSTSKSGTSSRDPTRIVEDFVLLLETSIAGFRRPWT